MNRRVTVLSLGAGVQSSTVALMAAAGEIKPMPDFAVFADVGWEPAAVYRWLDELEKLLPFPVVRATHADGLRANIMRSLTGNRCAGAPFYTTSAANPDKGGMLRRQCTKEFKIVPIIKAIRTRLGFVPGQRVKGVKVTQWIGISLDEISRMKDSMHGWMEHRWPLVDLRMSRHDCLRWMETHGFPQPPRSACIGCPYRSNAEWRAIRAVPSEWADAVEVDRAVRQGVDGERMPGVKETVFLHRDLVPLEEADLDTEEDKGQLSMFNNECEGMCGV